MIMRNDKEVLIIAHRGASSITTENTLKSFQKAIELEADYIEFDVHLSKDGEMVINHDAYITQRNGKTSYIKDMTLKELKTIDLGDGENIPTLNELIEIAKGKIGLLCEVKAQNLSRYLFKLLKQENLIERSIISSFSFNELVVLQKLEPSLKWGLILSLELVSARLLTRFNKKAANNNFFAVHPYWKAINGEYVKHAHDNNLRVNVWTDIYEHVNESELIEVLDMDIDGIIIDDIQLAKRVLNER